MTSNISRVFWLFLLIAIGIGIYSYRRRSQPHLHVLVLPPSLYVVVATIVSMVLRSPFALWNAARFAITYGMVNGYSLYSPHGQGPMFDHHYGPVSFLLYLPASLFNSPTPAVFVTTIISACVYFLPVLWMHFRSESINSDRLLRIGAFVVFCLFTFSLQSLTYVAFSTHSDASALGLSALACVVLLINKDKRNNVTALLSSSCAILAVWSKQVAAPIVIALPVYLLLTEGWRSCYHYVKWLILSGLIISGILLIAFNPKLVIFNTITILSQQPLRYVIYGLPVQVLLRESFVFFVVICAYVVWSVLNSGRSLRDIARGKLWFLLTIVGLFNIPTALLNYSKVQGDINGLSYTVYFLCAATTLLVLEIASKENAHEQITASEVVVFAAMCFLIMLYAPITAYSLRTFGGAISSNPEKQAFDYARQHPEEVYFPWHPLATLMSEGRAYHFGDAIEEEELAGLPVTRERFMEGVPSQMNEVAFYKDESPYIMKFLPEYKQKVQVQGLPGWTVYRKTD